ncbi:kielin/chordin-like protein [Saccoglossus kowalevskii]|uniref:Kielin/chordin-like protein-like n=1 Tax=Saccoglossus kowalevskii TaxID=10224 RepID=A0ABM0MKK6_SACKO|nr:PREDICTED: kielin/chordin-like protein-like [Saccoglossus kowalevskii]
MTMFSCCQLPLDCTDENGISYHDSSVWQLDSCTSCTCQHSVITCIPLPCPDTSCSHPSTPHGHCCPLCQGCLYLGIEVENGEIFSPNGDPCSSCSCQSGTVFCSVIECSQVDCQHPVVSDGKCCPACAGCEYEGRILSNGESFHKDQCINCVCVHGTVTCQGPEDCPVLKCFDQYLPTGECCARCRNGCEYEGVEFANGDFFTPMSNPCLTCSCTMSIVRCNPMRCPDITCSHPIKLLGACCENCADGCFYDNMDYGIGETWTTLDGCKQCTCIDGNVDCVSQQICQVECQHGVLLPGDCCSQCTDCLYNGKTFSDGSTFVVNGETCTQCSCQSGTVQCTTQTCPHINCLQTHIPEGSCCPVCKDDGCVDNYGRRHENNDEWRHPVDNCVLCRCIGDTINCETEQCQPTCSHGVKKPELCCPVCQGCLYRGVEYLDGDDVNNGNPCSQCTCNSGTVDCIPIICPQVRCHNPTILPNECCPVCHECTYSQSTFQDGETFVDPRNPCLLCTCEAGVVDCNRLDLDCIPECSHPGRMVDVCCPVCDTCEYERRNYANGIAFNPDSGDVCDICFCKDGSVTCQTQVCEQLTCKNAVQKSDECCPVCEVCIADGIEHEEGESWESLADPCAVCTCLNSRTHCRHKECPIMPCKHAARMNSDCCPSCHNCDYDRRLFRNGQIFLDPLNQCQQCLCQDGSVECKHIECPVLNCPNQVTDQGECCPKCSGTDCEYNGHSYYNEETFSNPLDPCEDCLCMLGVVTCVRKSCQPAICPYPVIEDCCQLCDGCTYNGVTYRNGQTFSDFSDRCKDCICQYGHVNCVVTECDVQCSHPVTIDNACCPRCDACFYEGRRLAIGQIFTDPNDQCLICSCDNQYIL